MAARPEFLPEFEHEIFAKRLRFLERELLIDVVAVGVITVLVVALGAPPALGAALGSVFPTVYALMTVRNSLRSLVRHTFQSQRCGTHKKEFSIPVLKAAPEQKALTVGAESAAP